MLLRWILVAMYTFFLYSVAYQSGYLNGFSLAKCDERPYSEITKCVEGLR